MLLQSGISPGMLNCIHLHISSLSHAAVSLQPAGDLCLPLDSLAPDVRGVARMVVLALYMLPLPTYMYESWSPSYIPGWAQRLMHVKQHHHDQHTQLWTGALILKVCHQQAVANPEAEALLLKATLPFDFVDLAVLQGIYKQMQLRLQVYSYCPV